VTDDRQVSRHHAGSELDKIRLHSAREIANPFSEDPEIEDILQILSILVKPHSEPV
jgi:hypothetical protein